MGASRLNAKIPTMESFFGEFLYFASLSFFVRRRFELCFRGTDKFQFPAFVSLFYSLIVSIFPSAVNVCDSENSAVNGFFCGIVVARCR